MVYLSRILLMGILATWPLLGEVSGCDIAGIGGAAWLVDLSVVDTDRGVVIEGATTDIQGIQTAEHTGDGLNSGPYFVATHVDSQFVLALHDNFARYEEDETSQSMSYSVTFTCATAATRTIIFVINVVDTNNNPPMFTQTDGLTFTVTPPLPPGYPVTGCLSGILVRDIDLTTQRIEFAIEGGSELFELSYDAASSTESKMFGAALTTTTFIRSLPEALVLTISATDVDLTGDPPRTNYTTIRIEADGSFELPEELVFSQVFYLSTYSSDHEVTLLETIYLGQGYDEAVTFNLTGEYSEYFTLVAGPGNQLTVESTELPAAIISLGQLFLELRAEREYTSGATATLVILLPEVFNLEFEQLQYESTIVDNTLTPVQMTLIQGYESGFNVTVDHEQSTFFSTTIEGNTITLTMVPLPANVVEANSFLSLRVIATGVTSSTSAIVLLEIIKDDVTTPVFEQTIYTGSYDPVTGLELGGMVLSQGYDDTVFFYREGEYADYFNLIPNGNTVTLQMASSIPQEILGLEQQFLLTVGAIKPRTVGATAAVAITLPAARELSFEQTVYTGLLLENSLSLETIRLDLGYADNVSFTLTGDHAIYFTITNTENEVTIYLSSDIPESVISDSSFLILTLEASGAGALRAVANIVLEIIKEDVETPVFTRHRYQGTYENVGGVNVEDISLEQGYDDTVTFTLEGDHSQYFGVSLSGNDVGLTLLTDIPEEVIYTEKVLIFNIVASKPWTVGANAAVTISFPDELTSAQVMRFSETTYIGALENNILTIDNIVLETGFTETTEFLLNGEFSSYFNISNDANVLTLTASEIPSEISQDNRLLILEVVAERSNAVSAISGIVILVESESVSAPLFTETYYRGTYTAEEGLQFNQTIDLQQGYDDTVTYVLDGEVSQWFSLVPSGEGVNLVVDGSLSQEIVESYRQLLFSVVANKPGTISGSAAISIDLPDEAPSLVLRFAQSSYMGRIESGGSLQLEPITLLGDLDDNLEFTIAGDYGEYFQLNQDGSSLTMELVNDLPEEATSTRPFLLLDIQASRSDAISGFTAVILEILREDVVAPVFDSSFYTASYSAASGLSLEDNIQLLQGYDESVQFSLEGDDARWFNITQSGNNLSLYVTDESLSEVVGRSHLLFSVVATKPGSVSGSAAVVISLADVSSAELSFTQVFYSGSIENDNLSLVEISLAEGYSENVLFILSGEQSQYFEITNAAGSITLELTGLPTEVTDNINVLILTIEAQSGLAVAYATVVLELITNPTETRALVFEEAYYTGSYTEIEGLSIDQEIRLIDSSDASVVFSLEGEQSQWFTLQESDGLLNLSASGIPTDLVAELHNLVFTVVARADDHIEGKATIVISLTDNSTSLVVLRFEQTTYAGQLQADSIYLEQINLAQGFNTETTFTLRGEIADYFVVTNDGPVVNLQLLTSLPETVLGDNRFVLMELEASAPQAISAFTAVILEIYSEDTMIPLVFAENYYTGSYSEQELQFASIISLGSGYNENVTFALEGENAEWFGLERNDNVVSIVLASAIPPEVLSANHNLIFSITASQISHLTARTAVIIALTDSSPVLRFEEVFYRGTHTETSVTLATMTLSEGYSENVTFTLSPPSELIAYFGLSSEGPVVTLVLESSLPEEILNANRLIIIEIEASGPDAVSAHATIILEAEIDELNVTQLAFSEAFFTGQYTEADGLNFTNLITLSEGYDDTVIFNLEGDHAQWFSLDINGNSLSLVTQSIIPTGVVMNNHQLIFSVVAEKPGSQPTRTTIVISLPGDSEDLTILGFEHSTYTGSIENETVSVSNTIILSIGFSENVVFTLQGDLSEYFSITAEGPNVDILAISIIPEESLPVNRILILEVTASAPQAISAITIVVLEVNTGAVDLSVTLVFNEVFYTGLYNVDGLTLDNEITLLEGFDETVVFDIEGGDAQWFTLQQNGNAVTLIPSNELPEAELPYHHLIFTIMASKPGASTVRVGMFILLEYDATPAPDVSFENALYTGRFESGIVQHEQITITGYNGSEIEILGVYAEVFEASAWSGVVLVQAVVPAGLPEDVTHAALELTAGGARTALVLDVIHSDSEVPILPTVTFSAATYDVRTDVAQTGLVGRVQATSDNGERVTYALVTDDAHLLERLSVSEVGELQLFAAANSGVYRFSVEATTVYTRASASADVLMTVEAISVCGVDDLVVPPLIVIERDEEAPHSDLVHLDPTQHPACSYTLTNRWPADQDWMYVNGTGLHTRPIDREHPSIAYMTLSQVQVEIVLHCDDDLTRSKRSLSDPYDYGASQWVISETISYNSRRTVVNFIVNDINDNWPIFVGKELEPIAVGYPVNEVLQVLTPRALVELQATDADVGENASLMYWSSSPQLAVSPTSGAVHVRDNAVLDEGMTLVVHATDRDGLGLTGDIQLMVLLLDVDHIAVITVRDAFLEDEASILANLSNAVGYEVKALSSVVISDEYDGDTQIYNSRHKRQAVESGGGASLQLYVYGLLQRVPVEVNQLTSNIKDNLISSVVVADSISLQDYLESREITLIEAGRDTALLVATVVLSILLFILIVFIALWFVLKWRKGKNYEEFSDENSMASRNDSVTVAVTPKPEPVTRPTISIEELKRSERRLRERLEAPVVPTSSYQEPPVATIVDIASPAPIVIQSIDKLKAADESDDEDMFGERKNNAQKKSVVTFNEAVEKIIHLEDLPEDSTPDYEVARL